MHFLEAQLRRGYLEGACQVLSVDSASMLAFPESGMKQRVSLCNMAVHAIVDLRQPVDPMVALGRLPYVGVALIAFIAAVEDNLVYVLEVPIAAAFAVNKHFEVVTVGA